MALDAISLEMIAPHLGGASVLCLGYPELPGGGDTMTYLKERGATLVDVVDVIAHKGIERILDLNEPQLWPRRYRLVINPGTLEHCFNLGRAWANAWRAVDLGGRILQVAPATMLDHGFWNVSPIAFHDWCAVNGGKVEQLRYASNATGERVEPRGLVGTASGRSSLPPETVLYVILRKIEDLKITWPTQGCYRS